MESPVDITLDLENRCLACLVRTDEQFPLYDIYEDGIILSDILKTCLSVEINITSGYPSSLCKDCTSTLIQFYNFTFVFEKSFNKLNALFTKDIAENEIIKEEIDEAQSENAEISIVPIKTLFACAECNQMYDTVNNLDDHLQEKHKTDKVENECREKLNSKYKDTNSQMFVCENCGKTFKKKSYLKDHQDVHRHTKAYKCSYCDKSFKRRTVWINHKRIHTHPNSFMCEVCGKSFNDNSALKIHIKALHVKERNHKCTKCNLSFSLKSTLLKHIRRHNKSAKLFECEQCVKKYYDTTSLKRHILFKHNDLDLRVSCQYCDKKYTSAANLANHVRKLHSQHSET